MSDIAETMVKMATLPKILEAATLLYELRLIRTPPNEIVKLYVLQNPDINRALAKAGPA